MIEEKKIYNIEMKYLFTFFFHLDLDNKAEQLVHFPALGVPTLHSYVFLAI